MTDFQNLADGIGKLANALPEAYNDGAKGTVQQTGKVLERIPRFINALAANFDIWIMKREAKVDAVSKLIDEKLENILEENIVSPEPHIAVPALQAIGYSMDSEVLRNMYANLLAKAMQVDKKDDIHPSFVENIKQMNPRDASNLSAFPADRLSLPIINLVMRNPDSSHHTVERNLFISNSLFQDLHQQAASIDLLETLGLIKIDYDNRSANDSVYQKFEKTLLYLQYLEKATAAGKQIEMEKGLVFLTTLGLSFVNICLK